MSNLNKPQIDKTVNVSSSEDNDTTSDEHDQNYENTQNTVHEWGIHQRSLNLQHLRSTKKRPRAINSGFTTNDNKRKKISQSETASINIQPVVFVIGAFSNGSIDIDYASEELSISPYALSASVVCGRICSAYEQAWDV